MLRKRLLSISILLFLPWAASAQLDFDQLGDDKVDLEALQVTKQAFMEFVDQEVAQKEPGLGTYGIVKLEVCHFPVNGRRLSDLKTLQGKSVPLISNPSCEQLVVQKLLDAAYGYAQTDLSPYARRRCLYETTQAFGHMMEYYTIKHVNPVIDECRFCEGQLKRRLTKIQQAHAKAQSYCGPAMPKIKEFLQDLSDRLDLAYQAKAEGLKKGKD